MRLRIFFIIIYIYNFTCFFAQNDYAYEKVMREAVDKSSGEIMDMARKASSMNDEKTALVLYMMVCNRADRAKSYNEVKYVALAYLRSGDIYYWRGHYTKALSLYQDGLKVCDRSDKKPYIAELYKCIGNIFCMFKDYEKAIDYYQKGYRLTADYPARDMKYILTLNTGYVYNLMGENDKAKRYYTMAKKMPRSKNSCWGFFDKFYMALMMESENNYVEAIALLKPLVAYSQRNNLPKYYECSVYEGLYRIYEKAGVYDSTLYYLDKCLRTAEFSGQMHMFAETLSTFADIYESNGDRQKADEYKARYQTIMDSTFNIREFSKVKNRQFLYEMEKIDKEIAVLNAEKENSLRMISRQRTVMFIAFVVIILIIVLLIVVWRQKQNLKCSYRSLFDMNKRLELLHRQLAEAVRNAGSGSEEAYSSKAKADDDKCAGVDKKYLTSKLGDEKRKYLIDKITYIMENTLEYAKEDFSLERLASLIDSNSKYVSQVINDNRNKNFSNFVNEYRVRLACVRLTDTEQYGNYTIHGIANSVGYRSKTTFVNVFHKIMGITPSAYQRMARQDNMIK